MKTQKKLQPRKQPKQRRAEERVAEIIAAYKRLLDSDAENITTNHVAAEAGIPVSSLYQYFPNKEALAYAVYRQWAEEAMEVLRRQREAAASGIDWRDFFDTHGSLFFGAPAGARLVYRLGPMMETTSELRAARRKYLQEMTSTLVETLQRLGSDWPEKPLANTATLLIELSTTTFHHMGRQRRDEARKTMRLWQLGAMSILQFCIETPYLKAESDPGV